jgi:hypothetical protein
MIATCHILMGAAIAEKTHNPFLGLFFAFLSHFILDVIPHAEYLTSSEKSQNKSSGKFLKIFFDGFFALIIILFFSQNKILALAGGFFGGLPDALSFLTSFYPKNIISKKYNTFHIKKLHFLANKKIPLFWRIFSQIFIFFISLYFLSQR